MKKSILLAASAVLCSACATTEPAGPIVHANQDDPKTDPTGNAGGRVACGEIN